MEVLALEDRVFHVRFACMRDGGHPEYYFFFRVHDGNITKVGQSPSLADLQLAGIRTYRKILGDEKYREFARGIGLHAHGVGIGAFVYLRRVFESLVDAARAEAASNPNWDQELYDRGRMEEKIRLLERHLPEFLVQNRSIYSILSRGVHELGEQECLAIFEPLKVGIELILDEKLAQQEKAVKIAGTQKVLAKITNHLGKQQQGG
jgi:hypothetical protein